MEHTNSNTADQGAKKILRDAYGAITGKGSDALFHARWQGESNVTIRGGELVDVDTVVAAIKRVGHDLDSRAPGHDKGTFPRLIHECIATLPEEEL